MQLLPYAVFNMYVSLAVLSSSKENLILNIFVLEFIPSLFTLQTFYIGTMFEMLWNQGLLRVRILEIYHIIYEEIGT